MTDIIDKFAEFVCWTISSYHHIPMLYETKTQNAGEFTYFVSHRRGILKWVPINIPVINPTT